MMGVICFVEHHHRLPAPRHSPELWTNCLPSTAAPPPIHCDVQVVAQLQALQEAQQVEEEAELLGEGAHYVSKSWLQGRSRDEGYIVCCVRRGTTPAPPCPPFQFLPPRPHACLGPLAPAGWMRRSGSGMGGKPGCAPTSPTQGITCPHGRLKPEELGGAAKRAAIPQPAWQ